MLFTPRGHAYHIKRFAPTRTCARRSVCRADVRPSPVPLRCRLAARAGPTVCVCVCVQYVCSYHPTCVCAWSPEACVCVVAGLGASGERRALAWDTHGEPLKRLAATGEWVRVFF